MVDLTLNQKENLKKMIKFSSPKIYSLVQFSNYMNEVFWDLTHRCEIRTNGIDINKFHSYLRTPFFISRLLFKSFLQNKDQSVLSSEDFINGFKLLFFDTIQNRIQFLFHFFDIDNKNSIHPNYIAVVLRQFHMIDNYCNIELLEKLISTALGNFTSIDYEQWKELLVNNSDIFVLVMIYITHYKPFQEENIAYYSKCVKLQGNSRYMPIKTYELLADSSEELYTYVNKNFETEFEYELKYTSDNEEDLRELTAFEEDKNELLNHLNDVSLKLYNKSSTKKLFETQINVDNSCLTSEKIERKKRNKEVASTTLQKTSILSQLRLKNGLIETIEGSRSISNKRILDMLKTDCFYNLKGRLMKCSVNLINNELYVLKYSKKKIKKFKQLLVLKHFYATSEENIQVLSNSYFRVNIFSDFDFRPYYSHFYFEDIESGKYFFNHMKDYIKNNTIEDKYDIEEELDTEETGTLVQAYSKSNLEIYLIKRIMKKDINTQEQFDQINWEISSCNFLRKADHPSLLKAYEIIETLQAIYLVYEYPTEGQLLFYLEKNKAFSLKKLIEIFASIASSISFLHLYGIAYGNSFIHNVFVNKIKKMIYYKVINYERSKTSPIQCYNHEIEPNEEEECSQALDVWNLGCLLFNMVYGQQPFDNKEKKKKLIFPELTFYMQEHVLMKVKDIIVGCLNTNVNKRLTLKQLISACEEIN